MSVDRAHKDAAEHRRRCAKAIYPEPMRPVVLNLADHVDVLVSELEAAQREVRTERTLRELAERDRNVAQDSFGTRALAAEERVRQLEGVKQAARLHAESYRLLQIAGGRTAFVRLKHSFEHLEAALDAVSGVAAPTEKEER